MIVTGSNGFVGSRLIERLRREGITYLPVAEPTGGSTLWKTMDGSPTAFVHLGAQSGVLDSINDPVATFSQNVKSTWQYLDDCRRSSPNISRFLFASSAAAAVHPPTNPYAASKVCGESACWAYMFNYGLLALSMRFSNVYGPGSGGKNSVIAAMCRDAINKGTITVEGGTQKRDFIHVDDVCNAIVDQAIAPEDVLVGTTNVSTGVMTSINDVAEIIAGLTDAKIKYQKARENEAEAAEMRPHESLPPITRTLEDGIRETVEYFKCL